MSMNISLGTVSATHGCSQKPPHAARPSPEEAAALTSKLFDQLDTQGTGSLRLSNLEQVLGSDAKAALAALDGDGDGTVTKAEFSSALDDLFSKLDDQMSRMKMERAGGPPPPPPNDEGFSKDEISELLANGDDVDDRRGELLQRLADNFDTADTDGNGRVTHEEARSFDDAAPSSEQAGGASAQDSRILQQILKLMAAYAEPAASTSAVDESA